MAVASMFHVVYPLQKFRHRAHGRVALLNGKRDALEINGVLYEYSYCAGHGEPKAAEEVVGPLLDVVVYSDVDLCHGSFSPLRGYDIKYLYATSRQCYTNY